MSCAVMVEVFRAANDLSGQSLYDLRLLSEAGGTLRSSCGGSFDTERLEIAPTELDLVFILPSGSPFGTASPQVRAFLRKLAAHGVNLGGVSGGAVILAELGLMKDRRFTVHWHHFNGVQQIDDQLLVDQSLFVIDRDRYTCAGGVSVMDMLHAMLRAEQGSALAQKVGDWYNNGVIREPGTPLRGGLAVKYGIRHPLVLEAVKLMDSHIGDPIDLGLMAELCDASPRQLTRLFQSELGLPPMEFYRDLRLTIGRDLLHQTAANVADIAAAVGYQNQSHFARAFKEKFAQTPLACRSSLRNG